MAWGVPSFVRMSTRPLAALFSLLLVDPLAALPPELEADLEAVLAAPELGLALSELRTHRVLPLLAHQLSHYGLLSRLPSVERERLLSSQRRVRELNALLFLTASRLLHTASALGTTPLVLKGLLLADGYYPDPSTRPMGDMDLVAEPEKFALLVTALERSGFRERVDHVAQDHARSFETAQGVTCDAHSYLESYSQADWQRETREATMRRVRGVPIRVLEPNLMLAHLVDHLYGHSQDSGLVLLWLVDIAFVLRRHAAEFELTALRRLLPRRPAWRLLLRILGLLEHHGFSLPETLAPLGANAGSLPRLTLGSVMRGRRTLPWGLPGPLGYLRVILQRLSLRDYSQHSVRTPPTARDLCLLPFDLVNTRWAELARYRE